MLYWNTESWLTIFAVSVLYPLNQIALWFFFKPIEFLLDRNLMVDLKDNPVMRGNFAPIESEDSYEVV